MIKMVLGDTAPTGWSFCDGSIFNISEYPILGKMIGNRYGGDGTETFAIPNLAAPETGKYVICLQEPADRQGAFRGLISQIVMFLGQELPEGWMYCDGRVLAADKYPVLKSVMGNTYGGDGNTTVGLPNMQGAIGIEYIMCVDGLDPRGEQASEEEDDDDY